MAEPLPLVSQERFRDYGILAFDSLEGPAIAGPGGVDFSCGGCTAILVSGWAFDRTIENGAIACPHCGKVNDLAPLNP